MASVLPSKSYARINVKLDLPNLIEVQLESFERLKKEGLADLFNEVSPIESYNKGMKLYFPSRSPEAKQWGRKYWFGDPKHTIEECVERDLTFASPMYVSVLLAGSDVPEPIKQDIFQMISGDDRERHIYYQWHGASSCLTINSLSRGIF
jgi:DNA-directed RNA polymerase subunit beta